MGGGVMRAAAKVAGIGSVVNAGVLRGSAVPSPTGHSVRKASIPVAATLSAQNVGGADIGPIEKAAWDEADEWQVVGAGEEELVMSAGEPMPRVVFDAAPSFKEAKEATTELKDAVDKIYLSSPKSTEFGVLSATEKVSGLSLITNPDREEMESLLLSRTSVPKHALQAFEMLSRSADAQNVVASLASDPNIWNAMMENSALKQVMESNKNNGLYQNEYAAETDPVSPKKREAESEGLQDMLNGFVQKAKLTVEKWVNDLSTCIQNIFEPPAAESIDKDDNGETRTFAASAFMGLALMVVMVVLMKRT